jgi:O-antigen/teichoic acid export membrane protein
MSILKKTIFKSIFSNTLWLLTAELIFKGSITILSIILARTLPLEEFGTYSVAFSFTALFTFLADFGIATVTTRDISQKPEKAQQILSQSLPLKTLLAGIASLVIIVIAFILGRRSSDLLLTVIFSIYVGINSLNIFLQAYFRATLIMKFEAISKIIQGLSLIMIAVMGIVIIPNIYIVASGFVISSIIALVYLYYQVSKAMPNLEFEWNSNASILLLRNSWVYGLSGFLALINLNFDAVMIGFTVSNELAGIYTAIYTILVALTFVMNIAFVPLFTIIARKSSDKVFLRSALIKLTMIMGIIGSIIGITIYILRQYILDILYGGEISLYPHILTVLSLVFVLSALRWPAGYILAAIGKQKIYLVILLISAFCNILLNIIFIPQFGIIAAAWTTVISEIITLIGLNTSVWIITQKSQRV